MFRNALEGAMDERQRGSLQPSLPGTPEDRLDSWKKIAAYLKRDVSTVQRWERREGMPVHRHLHDKQGSVYAFRSELHAWWESRRKDLASDRLGGAARPARRDQLVWLGLAAVALLAAIAGILFANRAGDVWRNPLASAQFRPLTDFEGSETAAAISRDGRFVAFLADHDDKVDAWVTEVGSGDFRNLTDGAMPELVNPSIRTLGFSPDAALVSIWARQPDGSKSEDISIWAAPVPGGALRPYLAQAAEFDWSSDGTRLVYHTTAPGDPMFVREGSRAPARRIHVAAAGVHCHFPVWSPDDAFIYFVQGVPPDDWDVWRIAPSGGTPERITLHNARVSHPVLLDPRTLLYLATDRDGSGPWLYAMDVERRLPYRISPGIERYTSLAASSDAARLVVTVANPRASLWRLPLAAQTVTEAAASPLALPARRAWSPRLGLDYLLYVSSRGEREGIWKLAHGNTSELWSSPHVRVVGAPAIAPDGRRIAFLVQEGARTRLYVMNADGTDARVLNESLELRGTAAWAHDGGSIVVAANHEGTPRLFRVPVNRTAPVLFLSEYSVNPVSSPDGRFVVYAGPDVGTTFLLRAAAADGRAHPLPNLILTRGARIAFLGGPRALVVLRGEIEHKNFWLIDLPAGTERQLTHFGRDFIVRDFDVSADGGEIVFDRIQENSDVVLIERD